MVGPGHKFPFRLLLGFFPRYVAEEHILQRKANIFQSSHPIMSWDVAEKTLFGLENRE